MAVKYNPNVALINGAAAIGRSTMPADLSGLDKVVESGRTMLETARKERQQIDDMLNTAADKVLAKAGGLGEEMFSYATDQVEKYKQQYLQGVSTRGPEGDKMKRAAMNKMIQLSNFSQEHKELNNISAENYKNGMFSTALTNDQKTILTSIFDENYTLSENSDGDMVYNIKVADENRQVTYDDYRELTSYLKDETFGNTYRTTRQSFLKEKDFKYDEFKHAIMQAIPNNELKFKLSIHDDIQGQKFYEMIMEDKSLTDDVLQSIANADPNDSITIDNYNKADTKTAIIDAITNPDNDAFDLQRSRTIMADKLTIAAQKKHNDYYAEIDAERQREINQMQNLNKKDGISTNYGYRTFTQLEETYNKLKNNELVTYGSGQNLIRFEHKENDIYVNPVDGKQYTKEYLRQLLEIPLSMGLKFQTSKTEGRLEDGLEKKPQGFDDMKKLTQSITSVNRGDKNSG